MLVMFKTDRPHTRQVGAHVQTVRPRRRRPRGARVVHSILSRESSAAPRRRDRQVHQMRRNVQDLAGSAGVLRQSSCQQSYRRGQSLGISTGRGAWRGAPTTNGRPPASQRASTRGCLKKPNYMPWLPAMPDDPYSEN
jgi:hypothetical protein